MVGNKNKLGDGNSAAHNSAADEPLPNHSPIALRGGGRFYRNAQVRYKEAVEYRNGAVKYLHNSHLSEFGFKDLLVAAAECNFQTGMVWYIRPDTIGKEVQVYVPLNNDDEVKMMFRLYNNLAVDLVQVYTQDVVDVRDPVTHGVKYVLPHFITRSKLCGQYDEAVRLMVEERLREKVGWDTTKKGLNEAHGKTWYLSDSPQVPVVLPCRYTRYGLRPSPFRGSTERRKLVEEDPIGEDRRSRSRKRRVI